MAKQQLARPPLQLQQRTQRAILDQGKKLPALKWKLLCRNHVDEEEKERKIGQGAKRKTDDNENGKGRRMAESTVHEEE